MEAWHSVAFDLGSCHKVNHHEVLEVTMIDRHECIRAFAESAAEAFQLQGPIYEFSFHPKRSLESDEIGEPESQAQSDGEVEIDRLEDLTRLPFADGAARTVICVSALEHVFEPRRAMAEMIRILAPGGMLLMCSPAEDPTCLKPDRYWSLTPRAVQRLMSDLEGTMIGWQGSDLSPHTIFGLGCKPPVPANYRHGTGPFLDIFQKQIDEAAADVSWSYRLGRLLTGWTRTSAERQSRREYARLQFVVDMPSGSHLKHHLLESYLPSSQAGTRLDMPQ